jgi:glycolate oxidase iron-sulfur subunit
MPDKPNPSSDPILKDFKKFEDIVASCNRCGFCTSYCPTYVATGKEGHSPRGRNQAFRALLEGKLTDPAQASEIFDTCLLCGECTSVCFSEVPTAQLMMHARHLVNRAHGVPKGLSFILDRILPNPRLLSWLLKAAFLGKRLGLSWALRRTGLLARFSPELAAADEMVDKAPVRFLMDTSLAQKRSVDVQRHEALRVGQGGATAGSKVQRPTIAYFPACGTQYLRPGVGQATLRLFERLKINYVVADTVCCGLPAASYGVMEKVHSFAQTNIAKFDFGQYESIVVDDSSCTAHLKEYSRLLQSVPAWLPRAHDTSQKVRELSTFFLQKGMAEELKKAAWRGGPVAYHDPCKAQYAQGVTQPPRQLLGSIRGLDLKPINDADQCCGGGGTYAFAHADLSREVLKSKVKNIMASGCKTLVTSSASCLTQMAFGLRQAGSKIEVLHLSEFLLRALETGV